MKTQKCVSKFSILIALLLNNGSVFSQEQNNVIQRVEKTLITADLFLPGLGLEQRIFNTSTIKVNTRLMPTVGWSNGSNLSLSFIQQVGLQFRYYYNLKDRMLLGRNVRKNSLNYIGLRPSYNYSYTTGANVFAVSPMWGLQRSYNNWYINTELGVTYYFTNPNKDLQKTYPLASFTIGYILFKK